MCCIIGDGEAETGTVAAAWRCKEFMNQRSGLVLPILHLNGYKMGGPSLSQNRRIMSLVIFLVVWDMNHLLWMVDMSL